MWRASATDGHHNTPPCAHLPACPLACPEDDEQGHGHGHTPGPSLLQRFTSQGTALWGTVRQKSILMPMLFTLIWQVGARGVHEGA